MEFGLINAVVRGAPDSRLRLFYDSNAFAYNHWFSMPIMSPPSRLLIIQSRILRGSEAV